MAGRGRLTLSIVSHHPTASDIRELPFQGRVVLVQYGIEQPCFDGDLLPDVVMKGQTQIETLLTVVNTQGIEESSRASLPIRDILACHE